MSQAKTPAQIAALFGCTEDQAREQIKATAATMRAYAKKAAESKTGKYRGYTAAHAEERAIAFENAAKA